MHPWRLTSICTTLLFHLFYFNNSTRLFKDSGVHLLVLTHCCWPTCNMTSQIVSSLIQIKYRYMVKMVLPLNWRFCEIHILDLSTLQIYWIEFCIHWWCLHWNYLCKYLKSILDLEVGHSDILPRALRIHCARGCIRLRGRRCTFGRSFERDNWGILNWCLAIRCRLAGIYSISIFYRIRRALFSQEITIRMRDIYSIV